MTAFNMGAGSKDGKGTKTDQGYVFLYVVIALLAVSLIVAITFAICKVQKPSVPEETAEPEVHDEFFFPDFENIDGK